LPAATLSTKRKTKIRVMATRPHFIHNMFPASLNYFPLPAPMAPSASTNAKSKEDSSAPITALMVLISRITGYSNFFNQAS
jgi:hypothetical protein